MIDRASLLSGGIGNAAGVRLIDGLRNTITNAGRLSCGVRSFPRRTLLVRFPPRLCGNSAKFCNRSWSAPLWVDRIRLRF
jgi:hypothetical protein